MKHSYNEAKQEEEQHTQQHVTRLDRTATAHVLLPNRPYRQHALPARTPTVCACVHHSPLPLPQLRISRHHHQHSASTKQRACSLTEQLPAAAHASKVCIPPCHNRGKGSRTLLDSRATAAAATTCNNGCQSGPHPRPSSRACSHTPGGGACGVTRVGQGAGAQREAAAQSGVLSSQEGRGGCRTARCCRRCAGGSRT